MPKELTTKYLRLAAGVYIARKGESVHVITTDGDAPNMQMTDRSDGIGGRQPILAKSNWITEEEVSTTHFAEVAATVFPDWRGQLINVAPEGVEPLLLPQALAPKHAQLVEALVGAEVGAAIEAAAQERAEKAAA